MSGTTFSKLPVMIVALVIGLILTFTAVMPLVSDYSDAKTFKNEGYFNLQKITSEEEYSLSWDAATPTEFTINGSAFTYNNNSGLGLSIVLGEAFYLRLQSDNTRVSFNNTGTYINTSDTYPTMTFTYSNGTVTATNGNSSRTVSDVSEIYGIMPTGNFVMKKSTAPAYLNSGSEIVADSEIYASGQSSSGNNNLFWHLEGTIDNIDYPDTFNSGLTVTNQKVNGHYNTDYKDLYVLDNLTFTATTSGSVVYNITASYFVVPSEVTSDPDNPTAYKNLVSVLPLFALILLVAGAASLVYFKNKD